MRFRPGKDTIIALLAGGVAAAVAFGACWYSYFLLYSCHFYPSLEEDWFSPWNEQAGIIHWSGWLLPLVAFLAVATASRARFGSLSRPRRWILRGMGVLLLLLGLVVAWNYFYAIGAQRRFEDMDWRRSHSAEAQWTEMQATVRRGMWTHDIGLSFGHGADKAWMAWLLARLEPGQDPDECGGGWPTHLVNTLRLITNQDAGKTTEAWRAWWAKNRDKSQEEWIKDGFAIYSVEVHLPPTEADAEPLLGLLGRTNFDLPAEDRLPRFIGYNAFRWLRDSDFDPMDFALTRVTAETPEEVRMGLRQYMVFLRAFPWSDGVGILAFGRTPSWDWGSPAVITLWDFSLKVWALMVFAFLLSLFLFGLSFRRAKPAPPGNSAPADSVTPLPVPPSDGAPSDNPAPPPAP